MRIDAYTHFFPAKYFANLLDSKVPDIGKRVREVPKKRSANRWLTRR